MSPRRPAAGTPYCWHAHGRPAVAGTWLRGRVAALHAAWPRFMFVHAHFTPTPAPCSTHEFKYCGYNARQTEAKPSAAAASAAGAGAGAASRVAAGAAAAAAPAGETGGAAGGAAALKQRLKQGVGAVAAAAAAEQSGRAHKAKAPAAAGGQRVGVVRLRPQQRATGVLYLDDQTVKVSGGAGYPLLCCCCMPAPRTAVACGRCAGSRWLAAQPAWRPSSTCASLQHRPTGVLLIDPDQAAAARRPPQTLEGVPVGAAPGASFGEVMENVGRGIK